MNVYTYYYGASQAKGIGVQAQSRELGSIQLDFSLKDLASLSALSQPGAEPEMLSYLLNDRKNAVLGVSYLEQPKSSGYNRPASCGILYVTGYKELQQYSPRLGHLVNFADFRKPESPDPKPLDDFPLNDSGYTFHHSPAVLASLVDGMIRAAFGSAKTDALLVALPKGKKGYVTARYALAEALQCLPGPLRSRIRFFTGLPALEGETDPVAAFDRALTFGANVVFCPPEYYQQIKRMRTCVGVDMDLPDAGTGAYAKYVTGAQNPAQAVSLMEQNLPNGYGLNDLNTVATRIRSGAGVDTVQSVRQNLRKAEEDAQALRKEYDLLNRKADTQEKEIARLKKENKEIWEVSQSKWKNVPIILSAAVIGLLAGGLFVHFVLDRNAQPAVVIPTLETQTQAPAEPVPAQNGENQDAAQSLAQDMTQQDLPQPGEQAQEQNAAEEEIEIQLPRQNEPLAENTGYEAEAASATAGTALVQRTGTITGDSVNMRAESNAKANTGILYILHKGNKVTIIQEVTNDQGEKWYEIEYDNRLGYVLSKYVRVE